MALEQVDGNAQMAPVSGGLVTALTPVMNRNHGLWVGWPGCDPQVDPSRAVRDWNASHGYKLAVVPLTPEEIAGYYQGFANQTIWPLFHDLLGRASFEWDHWRAYCAVNRRFAEVVDAHADPVDHVWVHDYQLLMVGQQLRAMRPHQRLSFFLHIPFPAVDLFRRLPWKGEILRALLDYDRIGFQTARDRRNFVHCLREFVPNVEAETTGREATIRGNGWRVIAGHYPISIDFQEFHEGASRAEVAAMVPIIREQYRCEQLILGVDRLDYSKGIPERFLALERALEKHPDLIGRIALVQLVIPSRVDVPEYQKLRSLIDESAGRINARFAREGWMPIHYMFREMDRTTLLSYYRACEVALLTPLRDGMNLVAKEYCASTVDNRGALVLSEFAGAAEELRPHAICVNPHDREQTADAIHAACTMDPERRQRRMMSLRADIRRNDVHRWLRSVLGPFEPRDEQAETFLEADGQSAAV
jgi:trehalose 6-phosphate synthase